jgi:multidrug resistance efflux pump
MLKEHATIPVIVDIKKQLKFLQRMGLGTFFLSLAGATVVAGGLTVKYRLTHLVVDNGLVNGRLTRLQAPIGGSIKAFYARPGVLVKTGQVLARIGIQRTPQEEAQVRLQLERSQSEQIRSQLESSQLVGEVQSNTTKLATARQYLDFLHKQLQSVENQYDALRQVDVQVASEAVSQQKAVVEAAVAKAAVSRLSYERNQNLGLSMHEAEKLRFAWESAEAEVRQARAALSSAQASFNAAKKGVALSNRNTIETTLSDQRMKLLEAIQSQVALVSNLEAQVASSNGQQFKQAQSLYKNRLALISKHIDTEREQQVREVLAPFTGVVYSTKSEQGEQVIQSQPILSLLDCNTLWIEAVVRTDEASRIDTQKPVRVKLTDSSEIVPGEIDLIQPLSSIQGIDEERSKLMQVQAFPPAIPSTSVGQPMTRVTIRIPPPPAQTQSQRFCGLGQSARLTFSKKPFGSV